MNKEHDYIYCHCLDCVARRCDRGSRQVEMELKERIAGHVKMWAELEEFVAAEMKKDNNACNHMGYETLVDVQDKMEELQAGSK